MLEKYEPNKYLLPLVFIIILMLANWGLESLKWRFLFRKYEKISVLKALQATFAGTTVSIFTPNRTGEFFGRVFILNSTPPLKGILITIIGSMSQLLVTIVMGSLCLLLALWIFPGFSEIIIPPVLWGGSALIITIDALLILLFFNVPFLSLSLQRFIKPRWLHIRKYMRIFAQYSGHDLLIILGFSFLRFIIFSSQYVLLIKMLDVPLPFFTGLVLIGIMYLFISAVPSIALSELGIRGSIALFVFDFWFKSAQLSPNDYGGLIIAASILIWMINIITPAIIGSLFLFRLRFIRKNV